MPGPTVVLLDVNETLADLSPLRRRIEEAGAPGELFAVWFASTLRDGFALTAAGSYAEFRTVAFATLRGLLSGLEGLGDPDAAAEHVLGGFAELDVHADVEDGLRALREGGIRVATLTNGAAEVSRALLRRAGLDGLVERCLSVEAVRRWKPAPEPYLYAASTLGVEPATCALIAVHPWDIDGAKRAGLRAGWLNRDGEEYPGFFERPDGSGPSLAALAGTLLGR